MTRRLVTSIVLVIAGAAPAPAQQAPPTSATSLAISAGIAHANADTRPTFGGSARWELTPHVAFEGAGRWMDRVGHPDASAVELAVVAGLGGTRESAVPYLLAGVGLQHRAFEMRPGAPPMPHFYGRRVADVRRAVGERESFTDPTVVVGLGVDVPLSRTVTVRPDARALFVLRGGRHDTVLLATVGVGYRFEHKPVTPSR